MKITKEGEIKRYTNKGDVGLDIGTQTIEISSIGDVKIYELADRVQNIESEKLKLLRKLDRSRRKNNPGNYNEDGTIQKQGNKKVIWINSNRYVRTKNKLKELYRKQADVRKYQHECLANEIINQGDKIYVETMNYKGLQKKIPKHYY
ncbi:MAG: transposase [Clostridiales bacterium]|nr:transposase [Clostridiales bacterium]